MMPDDIFSDKIVYESRSNHQPDLDAKRPKVHPAAPFVCALRASENGRAFQDFWLPCSRSSLPSALETFNIAVDIHAVAIPDSSA